MLEYCVNIRKQTDDKKERMVHNVHKMDLVRGRLRHCLPDEEQRFPLGECPDVESAIEKAESAGYSPAKECIQCRKQG